MLKSTKDTESIISDSLIKEFTDFRREMMKTGYSADALAETMSKEVNPSILKYARSADAGSLTTEGFKTSITGMTVSAKAGTVAMKALSVAMNMAIGLGIGLAINAAIKGITSLANRLEEAKDRAKELVDAQNDVKKSLAESDKWIQVNTDRYAELSKGVDTLGRNISLTDAEFKEHNSLANEIADMFPKLVIGYTDTGDAILKTRDNVALLNEEYEKQQSLARQQTITDANDVYKGFKAETTGRSLFKNAGLSIQDELDIIESALSGTLEQFDLPLTATVDSIGVIFENAGVDAVYTGYTTVKQLEKLMQESEQEFTAYAQTLVTQMNASTASVIPIAQAYLGENQDFVKLEQDVRDSVQAVVQNLGTDFYEGFDDGTELGNWINGTLVPALQDAELQDAFQELFTLDPKELSVGDYADQIDALIKTIAKALDVDPIVLKVNLGLDTSSDRQLVQDIKDRFDKDLTEPLEEYIDSLTLEEIKILWGLEPVPGATVEDLKADIEEAKQVADDASPITVDVLFGDDSDFNKSIDEFQSKISTLKSALETIAADGSLDSSALTDLIQQFPELLGHTDDLKTGIMDLISSLTTSELQKFDEQIEGLASPEEQARLEVLKDLITSIGEEAVDTTEKLSTTEALSNVAATESAMYSLNQEILENGKISTDTISGLMSAYPQLTKVLEGYINGLYTEKEVLASLSDQYDDDVTHYINSTLAKLSTSEDFYNKVYSGNSTAIQELAKTYNLDYRNWHSLAQAKLDIENELIRKLSGGWSQYYSVVKNAAGTYVPQVKLDNMLDSDGQLLVGSSSRRGQVSTGQMDRNYLLAKRKAQETADLANKAIRDLDKIAGLSLSLPSTGDIIKGSTKDWRNSQSKSKNKTDKTDNTDYYLESFKDLLAQLQFQRDMDVISEAQYYNALDKLNNQYFKGKSKYLDEYRQYEVEVYQGLKKLEEQRLSDLLKTHQNRASDITVEQNKLVDSLDYLNLRGEQVSASLYASLISNANSHVNELKSQQKEIQSLMNRQLSSGFIELGTDEHYEFVDVIRDIDREINSVIHSVEEWQNAINALSEQAFEGLVDRLNHVRSELDTFISLLSNRELTDVDGFTKEGIASVGLYAQQLELAQFNVKKYSEEIKRLNDNYKKGLYSQSEYKELLDSLTQAQWSEVLAIQSAKDGIVELNRERVSSVKDGLEKEYNAYQKIIQAKKDALNSEKSLHDYRKSIAEKEKDVANLQRQIATLASDDSMEARTKTALLQEELAQAQARLEEEQYDHSIKTQQAALDKELENHREQVDEKISLLEEYLENENQVIVDSLEEAKQQSSIIGGVIADLALEHGITVSDSVVSPWVKGTDAIANYGTALSSFSSGFTSQLNTIAKEIDDVIKKANQMANSIVNGSNVGSVPKPPATSTTKPPAPKPPTGSSPTSKAPASSTNLPLATVKYQGNKGRLRKEVSVVDRLKSHDLDSSAGARSQLYRHFGGSGTYNLSAKQNEWLIKKLKESGFKDGGVIGDLINKTGEDGFVLARSGESIMTKDATELFKNSLPKLDNMFNNLTKITTKMPNVSSRTSQPVINLNYDKLINVEGNIDKDFTEEFKRLGNDVSDKIKVEMYDIGKKWLR